VALLWILPGPLPAQNATEDSFRDPAARELLLRARAARDRDVEGMSSYEGLLRERMYVGLTAFRFRRERGVFEQERIARLRWSADGERVIQWIGARRAISVVGADTRREEILAEGRIGEAGAAVQGDLRQELPEELLREVDLPAFTFDPAGDRLAFGDDWALHPLSDTADAHYRFSSGDTLRLQLPMVGRDVVLYEVQVEPRRADFHLVAGSLWFEEETASLVRASYRPARAFDLAIDEPQDAEEVPGFLRPVQAEVSYITVEYSLHEFRFWLPRRFAMEGEARLGSLLRVPLTVEWSVSDYSVNQDSTGIPVGGPLPPGWSRSEQRIERDGEVSYVTLIVPPTDSLLTSPTLSDDFGERAPVAFTDEEVDQLRGELETLLPTYRRFRPRLAWGLERGLVRFNRVEGMSVGGAVALPLSPTSTLDLQGRVGSGDRVPNVTMTLTRGPEDREWSLSAYHRLQSMADWADPFSFTSSLGALVLGIDRGQYYRATGATLEYARMGKRVRWRAEAFYEAQREVTLGTDFFLSSPIRDDTVDAVIAAEPLDVSGGRATLAWFSGVDPDGLILTGRLQAEVATGDASYRRAWAKASAAHPLPFDLAGAVEVAAGSLWGDEPLQRSFFLGGAATLRGLDANQIHGPSFWHARAEVATGFAGARVGLFSDAGWVGPRREFTLSDPWVSVGVGTSLLDGIFRFDVSRAVRRDQRWKVQLYLDGLF
jgi:hypothetical protein